MRYKIIITGPVGAGKTTAINALTDDTALKTDVPVSDQTTSQRKATTTVALDYGVIKLNDIDVAHVYGTPGQERFDFMWEILSEGAHGLIILLDNSRNYPFRDLKYYSHQFTDLIRQVPVIIGVTRMDERDDPDIDTHRQWASELNLNANVLAIDARKKEHIEMLVEEMLKAEKNVQEAIDVDVAIIEPEAVVKSIADTNVEDEKPVALNAVTAKQTEASPSSDSIQLSEKSMAAAAKINGVTGVSLTNDMGELIDSTILDDELNEFIAFLSGITPSIQESANLGEIHRVMLRGPKDENLTIFVENDRSLGVTSQRKTSVPALSQQIQDMLQWM